MASISSSEDRSQSSSTPQPQPQKRRKFSKPPVKLACLSCRSLRTRCDGQERCANCIARDITCCYIPSRRGGPRVYKKKTRHEPAQQQDQSQDVKPAERNSSETSTDLSFTDDAWFNQLVGLTDPGAGLPNVEMPISEIENIFDTIFAPPREKDISSSASSSLPADVVQIYGSDEDILDAYYVFIHPYYPILPPPERLPVINRPLASDRNSLFKPSTPLSLAISALLVLIPHPFENDPSRLDYVRLRRDYAQSFAQSALEAIEMDSELLHSSINPSDALSEGTHQFNREHFHPKVPVYLESILALNLLSVYEYVQRGNMTKMKNRAGQALTTAMCMSLHEATENDQFAEARRRAWWMTYVTACQGSIVSNTPACFDPYDERFVTPFPTFVSDPQGWSYLIKSQQTILAATKFVHDLDKSLNAWSDLSWIPQRMLELDDQIEALLNEEERTSLAQVSATAPVDSSEAVVAKATRLIAEIKLHSARIKTHRFCAFSDVPIFLKRHCDLGVANESRVKDRCSCRGDMSSLPMMNSSPMLSPRDYASLSAEDLGLRFSFSAHASSKICLHSALSIVTLVDNLPYPNPNNSISFITPPCLSELSTIEAPRTMPTFACCVMQSSYALLMLCFKTRTLRENGTSFSPNGDGDNESLLLAGFINDLYKGLQLAIKGLSNYSIAFEAMQGMRDEISQVVARSFP
ncbi:transcriptional regulator family: Fungal Specific TF [Paecilomyces variotii]|nr:transcriptional regulator family: Fungal Specific TF [Paecilomyces variotii]KAJ9239488.1 transcriptional regulator family: Fungal Specific TF [Paecilomyces variotii]KAJ9264496.1 transcriptional regulator family: Fungal Specific TF [Paecilomyces variotii]KAJ9370373.1 transcriptional regulator family: Fungal Specific TF [Paecilomyces variotii]